MSRSAEEARLVDLLKKQATQERRKHKNVKGSRKRKRAAAKLHRIKGKVAQVREWLARHRRPEDKAVGWAMTQQGVTEHPDGSNWGEPVSDWIKRTGYGSPVPWCGCFVHEAVVGHGKANIPDGIRLGYDGNIIDDATSHRNGLSAVPFEKARAGDIVVFDFHHIALVRGTPSGYNLPTIEGNTSPTSSGSQFNGGCVAAKTRSAADVAVIARPTYPA